MIERFSLEPCGLSALAVCNLPNAPSIKESIHFILAVVGSESGTLHCFKMNPTRHVLGDKASVAIHSSTITGTHNHANSTFN